MEVDFFGHVRSIFIVNCFIFLLHCACGYLILTRIGPGLIFKTHIAGGGTSLVWLTILWTGCIGLEQNTISAFCTLKLGSVPSSTVADVVAPVLVWALPFVSVFLVSGCNSRTMSFGFVGSAEVFGEGADRCYCTVFYVLRRFSGFQSEWASNLCLYIFCSVSSFLITLIDPLWGPFWNVPDFYIAVASAVWLLWLSVYCLRNLVGRTG